MHRRVTTKVDTLYSAESSADIGNFQFDHGFSAFVALSFCAAMFIFNFNFVPSFIIVVLKFSYVIPNKIIE